MTVPTVDILIIGTGFGGIGVAIKLLAAGHRDLVLLERADNVGGCWRDNHYPGAACDVPSHLYSYSFEPWAGWSRAFAPQREIDQYIRHCAEKYGVLPKVQFGADVSTVRFDTASHRWQVRTRNGREWSARAVITATGQLSQPAIPRLKGIEHFSGPAFHSAAWRHDVDLLGKRVAVIGTGASAIQFVPEVAHAAGALTVFQRSAPYLLDKPDKAYSPADRERYRRQPWRMALNRLKLFWQHESRFVFFRGIAPISWFYTRQCLSKLEDEVHDPETRRKLTPDYPLGCKRILISNNYYPAFNESHVSLVTTDIDHVEADAIVTTDGQRYPADVIIYGTGFRSTEFLTPMEVVGVQGVSLNNAWKDGAEAYLGIMVHGFPNLFMLYGPNTNLGHNSILTMLESQFTFVVAAVSRVLSQTDARLDVRPDVQDHFNRRLQQKLRRTVWGEQCSSWYKTDTGKITNNWYGFVTTYRRLTRRLRPQDFRPEPSS